MVVIACVDKMIDTVECPLCKFYEWKLLNLGDSSLEELSEVRRSPVRAVH